MKKLPLFGLLLLSLLLTTNSSAQTWDPIGAIDANHPFPFKDGSVYFRTALDNNGLLYTAYPSFNRDSETIIIKTYNETNGLWEKIDIANYTEHRGRDYILEFDSNNNLYIAIIGDVDTNYGRALVLKKTGTNLELVGQADITGKEVRAIDFKIADDDTMSLTASSMNYVWNDPSQNYGVINTFTFDGTNWTEVGQEINVDYTNSLFLKLAYNSSNELILGHNTSAATTTYFKKLNGNAWVDYKTTTAITYPQKFLLAGSNENIWVSASNGSYQGEVWKEDGGFTKVGTISTEDRSTIDQIKTDINGDVAVLGSGYTGDARRQGYVKTLDASTSTWNTQGSEIPLVNGFGYDGLLFDAQNTPIISYYEQIGVTRKLNTTTNKWDYLGSPGILELPAFSLEFDAAYDADENLHVLMTEYDNGAFLAKYNNETNAWEKLGSFLEGEDVDEAKLIINEDDGYQYIAFRWRESVTNDDKITVYKNENDSWVEVGTNEVMEFETDEPDEIKFNIDATSNLFVTYWDDDDEEYIKVRKLNNNVWETIGDLRFFDEDDNDPLEIEDEYRFALNSEGVPFITLMHDDYDKVKLFKYDTGTTWTELDITEIPDAGDVIGLNITSNDIIYLTIENDDTDKPLMVQLDQNAQEITTLNDEFTTLEMWGDEKVILGADDIPFISYLDYVDYNTGRPKFQIQKYNETEDIWESLDTSALADVYWDEYELMLNSTNKLGLVFDHGFVYAKGFQAPFIDPDTDGDGVGDSVDECDETPDGETADENGCSDSQKDTDDDGIMDDLDECENTPDGETVDENGCSDSQKDTDDDGIMDDIDECENTPDGETVDENGCSDSQKDTDGDGVSDDIDSCENTPVNEEVDEDGCSDSQKDTDNDGVIDTIDECDDTPIGETVNENGCPVLEQSAKEPSDSDADGVPDVIDECANTPKRDKVDAKGCTVLQPAASGFTPNGDGVNDQWVIPGIENYPNNTVKVYNRWGNEVYSAKAYQNTWEGFYKNNNEKLPAGQYMYVIDLGDTSKPIQGWIFLNY